MQIGADGLLHHLYWGAGLTDVPSFLYDRAPYRRAHMVEGQPASSPMCSREYFHYECPTFGTGDFRIAALTATAENTGLDLCDLQFVAYRISEGREELRGLPFAVGEAVETLEVLTEDPLTKLKVSLFFHLFEDVDVITRHMRIENGGDCAVRISEAMSATVDFENGCFSLMSLDGTTLREFTPCIQPLRPGVTEIGSTRGASSHQHNPNIALLRADTNEVQGEVFSFSMLYSGSYTLRMEQDAYGALRVQGGIQPRGFGWRLMPAETFDTPEIALCWSDGGCNGLSGKLHAFVRNHLLRGPWAHQVRPLLLNTWEACYFDVNEERLLKVGEAAARHGVELLVLDDGWFGCRNAANSSLGDWFCNSEKFPHGLSALSERFEAMGLKMGLWIEPEMVSTNSELYRKHPDWCLHAPGRVRTQWRNQLVLDLSREEVVHFLISAVDALLKPGKITYLKWDMNRRLTEAFSEALPAERQAETRHRYMRGVYRLLEHIAEHYPEVLMENCASGGGRFDYGMLCYFHQGWLSDNTDAVCRLSMQNAASVFFPPETITSHVAASPNQQIGRITPIGFRGDACALMNAGYELDPTTLSQEETEQLTVVSDEWKALRETVQTGRFYRLNPELAPSEWFGWMVVNPKRAVIAYYRPYCRPESAFWTIPLRGLRAEIRYRDLRNGEVLTGRDWERVGLWPDWREGDCYSQIIVLESVCEP